MDLIDRYLHAVRDYLPSKNGDDIVSELRADLRAQVADREETFARPLTIDEQAELLTRYGHPMRLASEYRPVRQLISPALYPFYVTGLKISVGIALLVQAAFAIAMVANGRPGAEVIGRLASFPFTGVVTLFGWLTLGFALVDLHVGKVTARASAAWDPRTLSEPSRLRASKPAWEVALEIMVSTVFLLWWLAIPRAPWLVFGPAASFLALGPAVEAVHLPVAVVWLVGLAVRWTTVFRPDLRTLRFTFDVGSNVFAILVGAYLLRAEAIVVQAGAVAALEAGQMARLVHGADVVARIGMVVMLVFAGIDIARTAWKWRGDTPSVA